MSQLNIEKLNKFFNHLVKPDLMFDNKIKRIELSAMLYDYLLMWANSRQQVMRFTQIKTLYGIPIARNESIVEDNYEFIYDTHNQIFTV